MSYRDKYRYYFSFDGVSFIEVTLNRPPVMIEKQDEGQVFFRRKLQSDLVISSKLNLFIFRNVVVDYFNNDKQNVRIKFRIFKNDVLDWEGSQSLRSCKINIDLGTISFKPEPEDDYKDFLNTNEKEIDIINAKLTEYTLTITQMSYPEEMIFQTYDEYSEWLWLNPDFESKWEQCSHPGFYPATYKRQRISINPGQGWYRLNDEFATPGCEVMEVVIEVGPFRRLDDSINFMLNELELGLTFYSKFFSDSTNYVTGSNPNQLRNIYLAQKSDIKRSDATEKASIGIVTMKGVLEWLTNLLNAQYIIEAGKLRVEHLTYFENTVVGLDLTGSEIDTSQEYEEDSGVIVRSESWELMDSRTSQFTPQRMIEYSPDRSPQITKKYPLQLLTSDIRHVINNPDDISDEGFVIVVADDNGEILSEIPFNRIYPEHNMHLSIVNLQQHYWKYLRPLKHALVNGIDQEFVSEIRKRKQKSIVFQLTDSIQCDANKLVRTDLYVYEPNDDEYYITSQTGKITSKTHDLNTDKVTIELVYSEDDVTKLVNEAVALLLRKAVRNDSYIGLSVKGSGGVLASNRKAQSVPGQVELIKMLKTNDEGEYVINVGFVK